MALDELFDTFKFLRERIGTHRDYLSQNETRTRQVLIDPLLKELGWDVGDPRSVELEYRIEKEYDVGMSMADYVLKNGSKLAAVIEAKRLGSALLDKATNQVLNYANSKGVPWMVVTDGNQWEMYEVFKQGELRDRLKMRFAITETSASECALKSLALWNPNIRAPGDPVEALYPVIGPVVPPPPPPPPADSTQLGELEHKADMKLRGFAIMPNGSKVAVRGWRSLYVAVARYLQHSGALSGVNPPFGVSTGNRYAVSRDQLHRDGTPFVNSAEIGGGLYLETNNSAARSLEHAKKLIVRCGGDLEMYHVQMSDNV